jgi:hypothetical protein
LDRAATEPRRSNHKRQRRCESARVGWISDVFSVWCHILFGLGLASLLKTAYFGAQDGALVFFDPRLYRGTRSAVVLCGQGAASPGRDPIACKPVKTADGRSIGLFTP